MANDFFDERKVKSNDIVNGLARKDIFDSKGLLLVKEGTRIREAHYERMRKEGLIQDELNNKKDKSPVAQGINYVSPNSLHGKLDKLITTYSKLQKEFIAGPDSYTKEAVISIVETFEILCNENIFQILGELHIAETSKYNHIKPLYIAASLFELINRYNHYKQSEVIDDIKRKYLMLAALLHNIGLLQFEDITKTHKTLTLEKKQQLRKDYPEQSIRVMQTMGFTHPITVEAVRQHNIAAGKPSFEASLLRTPFIYTGIAMPQFGRNSSEASHNPSREFAKMFSDGKLDPVLGGLYLKINGLIPIGSILLFDSREKAMVVKGPDEGNISSSRLRFLTDKSGLQLNRPGETFYLNKTKLVQKGITDHHQFAWNKFLPFTVWER